MGQDRLNNAIGLCMRAGRLKSGADAVDQLLRGAGAKMLLLDIEASDATRVKYEQACHSKGIPLIRVSGLGRAIGKETRIVAAVTDDGFAGMIQKAHGAVMDTNKN